MRYEKVKGGIRLVGKCWGMDCDLCRHKYKSIDCVLGTIDETKRLVKSKVIKEVKKWK